MPFSDVPASYSGTPRTIPLAAGTRLWRVHHSRFKSTAFNPNPTNRFFGGGRFDSTLDDVYPFLYAASGTDSAICETVLRDLSVDHEGKAPLPHDTIAGKRLSCIETKFDLKLVSLVSRADLSAVAQDDWLVHSDSRNYAHTRYWGHWIRKQVIDAQGFVWLSKRELTETVLILFGDRCGRDVLRSVRAGRRNFDSAAGLKWLNDILQQYRAEVSHRIL